LQNKFFKIKNPMKKIIIVVFAMFLAGSAFCQTPLDKNQQKKVKAIHKNVKKEHDAVLKDAALTVDGKKARFDATKIARDAQLAVLLTSEQIAVVKSKDPIDWNKAYQKIEKQEKSRLKDERDHKLREIDKQIRDIESQKDELKNQQNELKRRQKDINDQLKALKTKKKGIKAQYK